MKFVGRSAILHGMRIADARHEFPGAPGYLNTAAIGLPPRGAVDALQQAIADWQGGRAQAPAYDEDVAAARGLFARLAGVPVGWVAIGSQVSALVALAITAIPSGSRVLCPDDEFSSVIFPLLVRTDLEVTFVPLESLPGAIGPGVDAVALSLVQSSDGRVADLAAIEAAATDHGVLTIVDVTQGAGWLPFDATRFDVVIAGTYKWLLSPRGTAFMTVRPELQARMQPLYAGWYAGADPWDSIYGPPLRLATNARRFDLSPGWLNWVALVPALELLLDVGVATIRRHNVGLANSLREQLGLPSSNSAIVSLELDPDFDESRLDGIHIAYRAGKLRAGFHLYNTDEDVGRLAEALQG
ncbi:MAG: aminotransferase class V-fold PLP-dependent enzyme [Acidimicrobiia bacterium]|nr:aminotransferase class V-fold PLP-dependent enzyme [Acidimicrobiia bacterium]